MKIKLLYLFSILGSYWLKSKNTRTKGIGAEKVKKVETPATLSSAFLVTVGASAIVASAMKSNTDRCEKPSAGSKKESGQMKPLILDRPDTIEPIHLKSGSAFARVIFVPQGRGDNPSVKEK